MDIQKISNFAENWTHIITFMILVTMLTLSFLLLLAKNKSIKRIFRLEVLGYEIKLDLFEIRMEHIMNLLKLAGINIPENVESFFSKKPYLDDVNFDALFKIIKNLANERRIPILESDDISTVAKKLVEKNDLPKKYLNPIIDLADVEFKLRNQRISKIDPIDRKYYLYSISLLIDEIKKLIVIERPSSHRTTQVGNINFISPQQDCPAATLYCLMGVLNGQRFPIDKPVYRLGANQQNDLVIANDDFVSGKHAYIEYRQGSLLLFDDGSRNGTFLNGERLDRLPRALKLGDSIKLGGCTFELI